MTLAASTPAQTTTDVFDEGLIRRIASGVGAELPARVRAEEKRRGPLAPAHRRALAAKLVRDALQAHATECIADSRPVLSPEADDAISRRVLADVLALGPLQALLEDPSVVEINANGCDEVWVKRADGTLTEGPALAPTDSELIDLIRRIAADGLQERRFDNGWPQVDVTLPSGDRLFAAMAVSRRPTLAIRRHDFVEYVTLDQQVKAGMLTPDLREFLGAAVRARRNIIVCGGTGAGKTTHARGLANDIPKWERIITIEDCFELHLDRFVPDLHWQVTAWQARPANIEGEGAVSVAQLARWALRANPDRVIVGEVRGDEVIPMLNAMTQGNDGSMCTIHANSSAAAFGKLQSYASTAPERWDREATAVNIANAVHLVIHIAQRGGLGRRPDRFVASVREVTGVDGGTVLSNEIYRPGPDGRATPYIAPRTETLEQLEATGLKIDDRNFGWHST